MLIMFAWLIPMVIILVFGLVVPILSLFAAFKFGGPRLDEWVFVAIWIATGLFFTDLMWAEKPFIIMGIGG